MKGICELYKFETELKESHIFPKFVVNYHKKTGSKYFRKPTESNKRLQDAIKLYLLSERAEQEFSIREKWFAENMFYPFHKGKRELEYNQDLYYFTISFLWRVLKLNLRNENLKDRWYYSKLIVAENEWREYLTNGVFPKTCNNNFLYFTHYIGENTTSIERVYSYLLRTFDATIITEKENSLIIYGKFNQFMFWSVLKANVSDFPPMDCYINPNGGKFKIPQNNFFQYRVLNGFLGNRIQGINNLINPSEKQQEKILKEIMKNPKEWLESDTGKSIIKYGRK